MSNAVEANAAADDTTSRDNLISPFLSSNPPPIIEDPWAVDLADINPVDGRLFQRGLHWAHFERLRKEDPVHLNEMPGFDVAPILFYRAQRPNGQRIRTTA